MFPLVEFPELVRHYAPFFKDVFSATAFIEFERYISGLIVSDLRQDIGWDQPAVCSGKPQSEFTQPAFCRFLDQSLKLPYVGTLAGSDKVNLKTGQEPLEDFATRLKQEHLERLQKGGQPIFQRITTRYMSEINTIAVCRVREKDMPHEKKYWIFYRCHRLERSGLAHRVRKKPIRHRPGCRACI